MKKFILAFTLLVAGITASQSSAHYHYVTEVVTENMPCEMPITIVTTQQPVQGEVYVPLRKKRRKNAFANAVLVTSTLFIGAAIFAIGGFIPGMIFVVCLAMAIDEHSC